VLEPLAVVGSLDYVTGTDGGLFGSLTVGGANGGSIINVPGVLSLAGAILLEVNTSAVERQVRSVRRAGEDDSDGDGFVLRTVAADTLRLAGDGRLDVGGVTFNGSSSLTFDPGRIRAELLSTVDVGFGSLGVSGEAWILHGEERETDFVFAGRASGRVGDIAGIDGTVLVNTSSTSVTLDSGTVVPADTDFDVRLTAKVDIGLFTLDVGGRLFKQADLWEVRVDQGTLNFFNVATVSGTGFYRSNGAFLFDVRGDLDFTLMGVTVDSTLALSLARDTAGSNTFTGSFDATSTYDFWFGSGTGPSFSAAVSFGPDRASFESRLSIAGITIPLASTWTWPKGTGTSRPEPVIARLEAGVLTLSAGDVADRYGDANGDWYGSILNESFRLDAVRDGDGNPIPGRVVVRALGRTIEFAGVTEIVADGGEGNDLFEVGPGIDAILDFAGGPGSDTFIVSVLLAGSSFTGGDGVAFDMLALPGVFADYVLASDAVPVPTIAPAATPDQTTPISGIESLRFSDRNVVVAGGTDGGLNESPTAVTFADALASLAEDAAVTSRIKVADIVVADDDVGTNTLSLSGVDADDFEIDGGVLYLRAGTVLDHETRPQLRVSVSAQDETLLGRAPVTAEFVLAIADANDGPTAIALEGASVAENAPPGTAVGDFTTTDADTGDTFTYELVAGEGDSDNASFQIVGGQLRTKVPLDFEAGGTRSIRVRSTDSGGLSTQQSFLITVTDAPDAPTAIALEPAAVPENAPAGTAVGTFATTDEDAGDSFTYDFVGGAGDADNTRFTIVGSQLRTAAPFDFEARSSYSIRVRSTDSDGLSTTRSFTISVSDVNDAPTDIALSGATVAEDAPVGTAVGSFTSTDQDAGDSFTYDFAPGAGDDDNALFAIVDGQLRTNAVFDYETRSAYSIRVRSTDADGLTTTRAFTVTVINGKEAPTITLPAAFAIVEDVPAALVFPAAPFGTSDADATQRVTVRLRVDSGAIAAANGLGVTVGGTAQNRVFRGTLADLNRYFTDPAGRIRYRPAADDHGLRPLTVTVSEPTAGEPLVRTAVGAIEIAPVNDAPLAAAPAAFRVVEDVAGPLSWSSIAVPFGDVDSAQLVVTLDVADGVIDAESTAGVTVEGPATRRSFRGTAAAMNEYFRTLGRITYTTAPDNTVQRTLSTTVSDGTSTVTRESRVLIKPVKDAPRADAIGHIAANGSQAVRISHAMLVAATNARHPDGGSITFRIESLQGGRLERRDGRLWRPIQVPTSGSKQLVVPMARLVRPGDLIRWVPPTNASGTVAAFTVRATDGGLSALQSSRLSVTVSGAP